MRGTITFNGWSLSSARKLRPGLYSQTYRNREGWTAVEMFAGADNHLVGIVVYDEKGKSQGTVERPSDLP
jgi:hypothetical protein